MSSEDGQVDAPEIHERTDLSVQELRQTPEELIFAVVAAADTQQGDFGQLFHGQPLTFPMGKRTLLESFVTVTHFGSP